MTSARPKPMVSVCVPMLDERVAIEACLDSLEAQTWPADHLEVIVADGGSTDGSREYVEDRAARCPWLRVVDNPGVKAAAGFNRGLEEATGDVFVIFSSHGVADPTFIERAVEVLQESGAVGVGGPLEHEGTDPRGTAVGLAMSSFAGMASPFRYAEDRRDVDTLGHPVYCREAILPVGRFDEHLERNADYEFNWRLRERGMRLVFDPSIRSVYRPRGSLRALARQFWWYGRWKERVVRRHPRSTRPRHLVAPTAVAGLVVAPLLIRTRRGRRLLAAAALGYTGLIAASVAMDRPAAHGADPVVYVAAFPVMHLAWGAGFLVSLLADVVGSLLRGSPR